MRANWKWKKKLKLKNNQLSAGQEWHLCHTTIFASAPQKRAKTWWRIKTQQLKSPLCVWWKILLMWNSEWQVWKLISCNSMPLWSLVGARQQNGRTGEWKTRTFLFTRPQVNDFLKIENTVLIISTGKNEFPLHLIAGAILVRQLSNVDCGVVRLLFLPICRFRIASNVH